MSKIAWCDATWNVHLGCSLKSAGCEHCYAMRLAHRGLNASHRGLTEIGPKGPRWNGHVRFMPERLEIPLRWKKPRRIFVNSMSDLFHESIPFAETAAVFGVMAASPQHVFQVLTKRAERMRKFFEWLTAMSLEQRGITAAPCKHETAVRCAYDALPVNDERKRKLLEPHWHRMKVVQASDDYRSLWPLPNVHVGVSVENQATADERIPALLHCPAAVRWVSYEPALGPIDFRLFEGTLASYEERKRRDDIHWIVVGGESGPGARPFDVAWARSTIEQCKEASVPCFVKQMGAAPFSCSGSHDCPAACNCGGRHYCNGRNTYCGVNFKARKGDDPSEWHKDLRVREFPL